jgi:hypothetical protein
MSIFLKMVVVLGLVVAAAFGQCSPNGLIVVVNKDNPAEAMSMAQLRRVLLGEVRSWPDKKTMTLVAPQPQSAAFKCMLSAIARMSDSEYHRYIANAEFRGEEALEIHVAASGPVVAVQVSASAGSIAIMEAQGLPSIASSVRVLKINGKQPGEAGYPL